jgi:hypothetical protein
MIGFSMHRSTQWRKETGARLRGSRALDSAKLQAPCAVCIPGGGIRLFYTAVGPAKPFPACQGYLLSAVSDDGLAFRPESGIRLAPDPAVPHRSLRIIAPMIVPLADGRWRMYVETRGPATQPRVICSAISADMLHWAFEDGIRLQAPGNLGSPRYLPLPDGRGRLYCCASGFSPEGPQAGEGSCQGVVSALTSDGLQFAFEPGFRLLSKQADYDTAGITAGEVIPPASAGEDWIMVFSAWQDVPPGTAVPTHPSQDPNATVNGLSENFAAASIASDMAGYRSRIFAASSPDGLTWSNARCVIEGAGYGQEGLDAVHAEDMSLVSIGDRRYRMYYAACDKDGNWRIASAITG